MRGKSKEYGGVGGGGGGGGGLVVLETKGRCDSANAQWVEKEY